LSMLSIPPPWGCYVLWVLVTLEVSQQPSGANGTFVDIWGSCCRQGRSNNAWIRFTMYVKEEKNYKCLEI
jgi:hypothetical protein